MTDEHEHGDGTGEIGADPPGPAGGAEWTDAELDHWFENDFGGEARLRSTLWNTGFVGAPSFDKSPALQNIDDPRSAYPDLFAALEAHVSMLRVEEFFPGEREAWLHLSSEMKTMFRRGWTQYEADQAAQAGSVVSELGPLPLADTPEASVGAVRVGRAQRRAVAVALGLGGVAAAVTVGLLALGGDDDAESSTVTELADDPVADEVLGTQPPDIDLVDDPVADEVLPPPSTAATTAATTTTVPAAVLPGGPLTDAVAMVTLADGAEIGYFGNSDVMFRDVLAARLCVVDESGEPIAGTTVSATLGADPAGLTASHGDAVTGADGCGQIDLPANDLPGESDLWTAIENEVNRLTPIRIEPPLTETIESASLKVLDSVRPTGLAGVVGPDDALFLELIPAAPWIDGVPETDPLRASVSIGVATDAGYDGVFVSISPSGVVTSFQASGLSEFPPVGLAADDLVPADVFLTDEGTLVFELGNADVADVGAVAGQVVVFSGVDGDALGPPIATRQVGDMIEIVFLDGEFPPAPWTQVSQGSVTLNVPSG